MPHVKIDDLTVTLFLLLCGLGIVGLYACCHQVADVAASMLHEWRVKQRERNRKK